MPTMRALLISLLIVQTAAKPSESRHRLLPSIYVLGWKEGDGDQASTEVVPTNLLTELLKRSYGTWYAAGPSDGSVPFKERQTRKFPEVDSRGFHEDIFDEGFGNWSPMKRF
ncbi:uncharacterized protein LOC111632254 [Centruroides sculpturatus]|uniref:uncharacterized protein LOC111632254 n=1 Tax=Centruroides sculpturatus TaxID=218467 RepID=UPI000C6E86C5|nr:uncharacterized protein LOC111632254 [Centruroides sculpturatus]